MASQDENIKLQFVTERALDSAAIRFFTWSPVSHVDMILPVTKFLVGARLHCGVAIRQANYAKFSRRIVAEVEGSAAYARRIRSEVLRQCGKPYDTHAILNFGIHARDWRNPDRWFCSELIAWAFEKSGYPLFSKSVSVNRITPRDLLAVKQMRVIESH